MTADTTRYEDHSTRDSWAGGVSVFAGTMMATVGLFQFFEGLSAVLNDSVYVTARDYVYQFDITTWGWIHLVIGITAVAGGAAILAGHELGFLLGIMIAGLSAVTNFLFLPWFPIWATVIIAVDIAVIWALCVRMSQNRAV